MEKNQWFAQYSELAKPALFRKFKKLEEVPLRTRSLVLHSCNRYKKKIDDNEKLKQIQYKNIRQFVRPRSCKCKQCSGKWVEKGNELMNYVYLYENNYHIFDRNPKLAIKKSFSLILQDIKERNQNEKKKTETLKFSKFQKQANFEKLDQEPELYDLKNSISIPKPSQLFMTKFLKEYEKDEALRLKKIKQEMLTQKQFKLPTYKAPQLILPTTTLSCVYDINKKQLTSYSSKLKQSLIASQDFQIESTDKQQKFPIKNTGFLSDDEGQSITKTVEKIEKPSFNDNYRIQNSLQLQRKSKMASISEKELKKGKGEMQNSDYQLIKKFYGIQKQITYSQCKQISSNQVKNYINSFKKIKSVYKSKTQSKVSFPSIASSRTFRQPQQTQIQYLQTDPGEFPSLNKNFDAYKSSKEDLQYKYKMKFKIQQKKLGFSKQKNSDNALANIKQQRKSMESFFKG